MFDKDFFARSIANEGSTYRLKKLMQAADKGEKLTLCFLGGSITQGSLSPTPQTCYAYLVYSWFVNKFPKSEFTYVNAGIGGTTSQFGVSRLDEDVLPNNPDFCMVEFSVNDNSNAFFKETYEAVVRRLYYNNNKPAVLILNNLFYEDGSNAQLQHNSVAKAYRIPALSVRDAVYPEIRAGRLIRSDITPDNLHPNGKGHAILAEIVTEYLERVYETFVKNNTVPMRSALARKPLTANASEGLVRVQNTSVEVVTDGFTADSSVKESCRDIFKHGWTATQKGASIKLSFTGSELAVQYRKTINKPAPVAVAVIDNDEEHAVILDANFEETWGDCLHIDTLLYHGVRVNPDNILRNTDIKEINRIAKLEPEKKEHTLEIRIIETHEDDKTPFYLVSILKG